MGYWPDHAGTTTSTTISTRTDDWKVYEAGPGRIRTIDEHKRIRSGVWLHRRNFETLEESWTLDIRKLEEKVQDLALNNKYAAEMLEKDPRAVLDKTFGGGTYDAFLEHKTRHRPYENEFMKMAMKHSVLTSGCDTRIWNNNGSSSNNSYSWKKRKPIFPFRLRNAVGREVASVLRENGDLLSSLRLDTAERLSSELALVRRWTR